MRRMRKFLILMALLLAIISGVVLLYLPKIDMSSGVPQGICSVETLLLDQSTFPPGTHISIAADFEDLAMASADRTFLSTDIDVDHRIEYFNTPFLAWQTYMYNRRIFNKSEYNDSWTRPSEVTFSSSKANQYHFACTTDTVFGYQCILTARYGRYFVFLRANLSQEFTIRDLVPLLQEIDARMSPCIDQ